MGVNRAHKIQLDLNNKQAGYVQRACRLGSSGPNINLGETTDWAGISHNKAMV